MFLFVFLLSRRKFIFLSPEWFLSTFLLLFSLFRWRKLLFITPLRDKGMLVSSSFTFPDAMKKYIFLLIKMLKSIIWSRKFFFYFTTRPHSSIMLWDFANDGFLLLSESQEQEENPSQKDELETTLKLCSFLTKQFKRILQVIIWIIFLIRK